MHITRHVLHCAAWLVLAASARAASEQASTSPASKAAEFDLAAHGFGPGPAGNEGDNGYIGIFTDPQGTQTCATIPTGQSTTLYLLAFLGGGTQNGMTGVEFRIEVTHPEGYFLQYIAPAEAITIGNPLDLTPNDPFDVAGLNLAFSQCRTQSPLPLGTIQVFNQSGGPTDLLVKRRNPPANPASNCPLFTDCTFQFAQQCMTPCSIDATGGSIVGRASINDPGCTGTPDCPVTCTPLRCVALSATAAEPQCAGQPITVTATARNCSDVNEDIDLFVAYGLAGSFSAVAPGQSVTASRTYTLAGCSPTFNRPPVGAVVRTADCAQPTGREIAREFFCETTCAPNREPDCSAVQASLTELWPPDGRMVSVTTSGFSDPDGDPLVFTILVGSDEPAGIHGSSSCPDAIVDGPQAVRLRAERFPTGNGRVYTIHARAEDPSGFECTKRLEVYVPRKPGVASVNDGFQYSAMFCTRLQTGDHNASLKVEPAREAGTTIRFSAAAETDAMVEVFDMRGRRLATVARSRFGPGEHVLRWDGRDGNGSAVATGIYLFRLTAGGNVETTKAIVMQ